ncbi:MAG: cellulase family glycosylhydrolase [Bdellovibrio sp.]|nr:cellulase family glycosylhydrolase [Bdellovibrio sp.]
MLTKNGKVFPSCYYFLTFLCFFLLLGCNSETDVPSLLEGTLTLKNVTQPSSIYAQSVAELDLKIENTGLQRVSVGEFVITEGADNFRISGGTCGTSLLELAPAESCNYLLEFSPSAEGVYSLGFTLGYYSGDSTVLKQLKMGLQFQVVTSTPVPTPTPTPSPSPVPPVLPKPGELVVDVPLIHDDTLINNKKEIIYTLKNIGDEKVRIDEFYFEGGAKLFTVTGGTCGSGGLVLQAKATCTYNVTFAPTSIGQVSQNLVVGYYPGDSWNWLAITIGLQGTGIQEQVPVPTPTPIPTPSPTPVPTKPGELVVDVPLIHGDTLINNKKQIIYTLKNIGDEKVRIDEFYFEGGAKLFTVTGGTCGSGGLVLQAKATCTYNVTFAPTSVGQVSQNMVVGYYPGDTWKWVAVTIGLQGTGIQEQVPVPTPTPTPTPVPTPTPGPNPNPADGRLHVEGRYIKNSNGDVVVLMGVNIADPEHLNLKPWERPNVTAMSVTKNAVENFHAKVIRLPIHPGSPSYPNEGWFGANGGQKYLDDHVKPLVNYLTSLKIYTIIDLHYVEDWSGKFPKVAAFWNLVAPQFKDNPYVIYEIYNEPIYPDDWNKWKSEIAQPAVDLVRGHAPENLIIVGGPLWSAHMAGALANPIVGKNIVYTAHIYSNQWPTHIAKNFGQAIEELPFFVTEWGFETGGTEGGNRTGYGIPFAQWMADHQFSWTAWCFDTRWGPRMFDGNWNLLGGEGGMGTFVQDLLLQNHLNNY